MTRATLSAEKLSRLGEYISETKFPDRKRSIPYRPEYNQFTGSVKGSILLQQIWFRWRTNGRKRFYKYRTPCGADDYRTGDSWVEELGFTASEFDRAIRSIGTKVTSGVSKTEVRQHSLVIYWTDSNRRTWYELNERLFFLLIGMIYQAPELLGNSEILQYVGTPQFPVFLDRLGFSGYLISDKISDRTTREGEGAGAPPVRFSESGSLSEFNALLPRENAPPGTRNLQTEQGRARAQAHILNTGRGVLDEKPWLELALRCEAIGQYDPPPTVNRDNVLRFIQAMLDAGIPLDFQNKSDVRFWIRETEGLLYKAKGDLKLAMLALQKALGDGLRIDGPHSVHYAVSDVLRGL